MKHKFTNKTKQEILDRDGGRCVICESNKIGSPHHIFFGIEAEYTEDANIADKGVLLCMRCHHYIHHEGDKEKRELCKRYLGYY